VLGRGVPRSSSEHHARREPGAAGAQPRRALVASGNDLGVFVSRPLTVALLLIAIAALVAPFVLRRSGAPPISAED
jgi:hypothetical protein